MQDLGPEADRFFVRAIGGNVGQEYLVEEGRPLGLIYGLTWGGIYNYDDFTEFDGLSAEEAAALFETSGGRDASFTLKEGVPTRAGVDNYNPGMIRFEDLNGDGVVNADDRGVIGDANPDHYGGLSNALTYKGVDLSFLFSWSYGNDVFNKNRIAASALDIPFRNKIERVADYWKPNAPDTDIWSLYGARDGGANGENHSFFVEDGSYLRLSNVTLGYQLPADVLRSQGGFDSARIYASVDNVHVWTNYSGYDPDVSVGNNALTPGLDFDSYPQSRTIRVGLELGL